MERNIKVKIPDVCYISPDPERDFPFAFSFIVTYGLISSADLTMRSQSANNTVGAVRYPTITINGFTKLLSEEKIAKFIKSLTKTGGDDWTIDCSASADIIIKFTGDDLPDNFHFSAATERLIVDTKENEVVTLTVNVEHFPGTSNHAYVIKTKVDYTPWAKALTFSKNPVPLGSEVQVNYQCEGDNIDKRLMQNGAIVDTARSPYTASIKGPSLFTLEVFNNVGTIDRRQAHIDVDPPQILSFSADKDYFSEGDSVTLNWDLHSAASFNIDNLDRTKDIVYDDHAVVYPKANPGARVTTYTLRANGFIEQKPNSISMDVVLTKTCWKKAGTVSGYFSGEVYGNIHYNSRVFMLQGKYYAYAHPYLYESVNCLTWTTVSTNDKAVDTYICLAADYYNGTLYAMGKEGSGGNRLYITKYDFAMKAWSYVPAYQTCSSDMGSFALCASDLIYSQTSSKGISNVRCGKDGKWNTGTSIIAAYNGTAALSGDYCFFKDRYYAVMLCDDHYIYVFDCDRSMKSVLFKMSAGDNSQFVSFCQTFNKLFIMTGKAIIDVKAQSVADYYYPLIGRNELRPWFGVNNDEHVCGIFPDKLLWEFIM